jgi:nucleoside-diphosphate-sugar epimerase
VRQCAARVDQWGDPGQFERVNVQGTANMLEAARTGSVSRFVHVGTEAVLAGGGPIHNVDETRPRASHPIGLYPASKARAEALVIAANGAGWNGRAARVSSWARGPVGPALDAELTQGPVGPDSGAAISPPPVGAQ